MVRALFSGSALRIAAIAVFSLSAMTADAQVKPLHITGSGPAPLGVSLFGADSPHSSSGNATLLGKYSGEEGVFNSLSFDPGTLSGTFQGSFVFVAANGDRLACTYGDTGNGADEPGEYQLFFVDETNVIAVFLAEFNPVPAECTGRFQKVVDGSLIMLAMSEPFPLAVNAAGFSPPFDYSWEGEGWLEFERGPR